MKYKLIEAMGLKVHRVFNDTCRNLAYVVSADDLEKALSEAPEVNGNPDQYTINTAWFHTKQEDSNKRGRVVCIQPIKREPVKVEFEASVTSHLAGINAMIKRSELIPFIGKYVRVTVEEIV